MTDLEQAIRAELTDQSAASPDPASTEHFALSLIGQPGRNPATDRGRPRRGLTRAWALLAVVATVLAISLVTVAAIHSDRSSRTPIHAARVSTDPRDLVGVEWLLSKYVSADGATHQAPAGAGEATLRFDGNGNLNYVPGCNYYFGSVTIKPGVLDVGPAGGTMAACNEVTAMRLLSFATLSWQITDHVLTIASRDGQKLIFVVRPSIYPSDYPGSPAITIAEGHIGTADYRFYYVPARDTGVWLSVEYRGAPGGAWGSSGEGQEIGWTGPEPDWNGGCQPDTIGHDRYLTGWATQDAAKVTVHNVRTGALVDVPLHPLTGTGGLLAYGGFIGNAPRGSTVSIYDAHDKLLGKPCPFGS